MYMYMYMFKIYKRLLKQIAKQTFLKYCINNNTNVGLKYSFILYRKLMKFGNHGNQSLIPHFNS